MAGEQLPFFVYGTLRLGQPNYRRLLQGRTVSEVRAELRGAHLYDMGFFPVAVEAEDENAVVIGEMMALRPEDYNAVIRRLDTLEGVDTEHPEAGLYRRAVHSVYVVGAGAPVRAWVYLGNAGYLHQQAELIAHGDWLRYRRDRSE